MKTRQIQEARAKFMDDQWRMKNPTDLTKTEVSVLGRARLRTKHLILRHLEYVGEFVNL